MVCSVFARLLCRGSCPRLVSACLQCRIFLHLGVLGICGNFRISICKHLEFRIKQFVLRDRTQTQTQRPTHTTRRTEVGTGSAMVVGGKFGHREGPPWLAKLLSIAEFFGHCKTHLTGRNEKNHFCFDCQRGPLCPVGVAESHAGHATVQIRKASHRDVVRVVDIHKLLDFSNIQLYTINSAKILFLQSRKPPQQAPKMTKGGGGGPSGGLPAPHYCHTCQRSIADPVRFCSLLCKLTGIRQNTHDFTLSFTLQAGPEGGGGGGGTMSGGSSHGLEAAGNSTLADFYYPTTPKSRARKGTTHMSNNNESSASKNKKKRKALLLGSVGLGSSAPHGSDQQQLLYTDGNSLAAAHQQQQQQQSTLSPSSSSLLNVRRRPSPRAQELPEFQQALSEFQQLLNSPSRSLVVTGPSTPKARELRPSTCRVRHRKQVHPLRAPLF